MSTRPDACARWAGVLLRLFSAGMLALSVSAQAHKSSDAFLQIQASETGLTVRWDIALRDLDVALGLDGDSDGRLTWGEVKAGWPLIERYALEHLQIEGCALKPGQRSLERRGDGAYAALQLASDCVLKGSPVIRYTLLRDVDPTHRGIARIEQAGKPLRLQVLDPSAGPALLDADAPRSGQGSAQGDAADAVDAGTSDAGSAFTFLREGVHHIVTGYDHVLFLLCLLLPAVMRRTPGGWRPVDQLGQAVWPIVGIVTAFTVAHSITLALAALKVVNIPSSFIEPAIAVTIAVTALDNLWPVFRMPRAAITFFFGLIHGFGFAGVLAELNLPAADFAWTLLLFNLGIEFGQLCIVFVAVALLYALRRSSGYSRWVIHGGSLAAIAIASLWFVERTANVVLLPM